MRHREALRCNPHATKKASAERDAGVVQTVSEIQTCSQDFGNRLEALVAGVFFGGQHRSLVCAPLAREADAGRLWIGSTKELADGRVTSAGDVATATLARDTATRLCLPHNRHGVRSAGSAGALAIGAAVTAWRLAPRG